MLRVIGTESLTAVVGGHIGNAVRSYVAALPLSADQLVAILFARPVHAMPVQQDVFQSFGSSPVKHVHMFVVDDGQQSHCQGSSLLSSRSSFCLPMGASLT